MNILTNQNQIKYTFCHPELAEGSQQSTIKQYNYEK